MKKFNNAKHLYIILLISCIIFPVLEGLKTSTTKEQSGYIDINEGWQYLNMDPQKEASDLSISNLYNIDEIKWRDFNVPGQPPKVQANQDIWLRVTLSQPVLRDPSILLLTYDQIFEVYLDNKLLYKFGDFTKNEFRKSPGSPFHLIDLPENYEGKTLYLRMYSVRKVNTGLIKKFQISSKSNHIIKIVKENISSVILAFMFIFVGLCTLIMYTLKFRNNKTFLYLCYSSICTGVWLLSENALVNLLLYSPRFWIYIQIISQYSIPIGFSMLIRHLFKEKCAFILNTIGIVHGILIIFGFALELLNILPVVSTLPVFYFTFSLSMLVCILIITLSFKEWSLENRIFSVGLGALCILGLFDIINWNFNLNHRDQFLTQWGMFIFLISLVMLLISEYTKNQEKVTSYSEEIKSKEKILTERERQLEEAKINDRLKTEFFSNISHELRTPLNIILSTLQLLNLYVNDGSIFSSDRDINKYFKIMKQNCYRLIRLVNNIIDITKIDSGFLQPKMENLNIVAIVENITLSVADYISSKGINLTFDTDVEEKVTALDPEKIERIMLNLLSNAVKFSNEGSDILVEIKDEVDIVKIIVKDTGIGLEKDKLDVIFERFAQVDKSLTRNHEGSGIGLSLVKSLVQMHDGTIEVESEYGKGSIFIISLPVRIFQNDSVKTDIVEIEAVHVEKVNIEFSDIYS